MTLASMTGFGEATSSVELSDNSTVNVRVQLKSVNHRYVDVSMRLPAKYSSQEFNLQKSIRNFVSRGRIECIVSRDTVGGNVNLNFNKELFNNILNKITSEDLAGISKDKLAELVIPCLFNKKEILEASVSSEDLEEVELKCLEKTFNKALSNLSESRKLEGLQLEKEVNEILSNIRADADQINTLALGAPSQIKDKFQERLQQLYAGYNPDDPRLMQEIAILSDKVDIREEIVRLNSHLKHFNEVLVAGGRKLEFIVQEMGREVNTIGSKTSQIEVSTLVINIKSNLEKLREQLQNIE